MSFIRGFIVEEDGMGTVEIVIIIAVLVGLALIFRDAIISFSTDVMSRMFANDEVKDDVDINNIRKNNEVGANP